jgi:hypothetical protein
VKSQKKIPLCYVCRVSINKKGLCNLQTITLRSKTADAQRRLSSQAGGGGRSNIYMRDPEQRGQVPVSAHSPHPRRGRLPLL